MFEVAGLAWGMACLDLDGDSMRDVIRSFIGSSDNAREIVAARGADLTRGLRTKRFLARRDASDAVDVRGLGDSAPDQFGSAQDGVSLS